MDTRTTAAAAKFIKTVLASFQKNILGLVVVASIVGGFSFGNGEVRVEAAVKEGYVTSNIPPASILEPGFTNCERIRVSVVAGVWFCGEVPQTFRKDSILRYKIDGCTSADCNNENIRYSDCSNEGPTIGGLNLCRTRTLVTTDSNGSTTTSTGKTLTDEGITCTLVANGTIDKDKVNLISISNCKDIAGNPPKPSQCIAYVNANSELALNCKPEAILLGSDSVLNWVGRGFLSDGRIFATANGGSLYIENAVFNNAVDQICTFVPVLGIFDLGIGSILASIANTTKDCSNIKSIDEFKTKLAAKVTAPKSNLVSQIVRGPAFGRAGSLLENRNNCVNFTKDDVAALRVKANKTENELKQIQQIDKLIEDKNWDGIKDLQLCNSGSLVCADKSGELAGTTNCVDPNLNTNVYAPQGGIQRTAQTAESKLLGGVFDELGAALFKIVAWVLAWLLIFIGNAALYILWALGGFVLWVLAQNPATPAFVTLLTGPWGLLAGIGNLLVLGAFLYTGFGYLLGISNMKKDLGEFIQKIIYYALILNFTLFGLATLVNIGYGMGNLIKVSYTASSSQKDVNSQLMGGILNGIGKVSTIRCGALAADCKVIDDKGETSAQQNTQVNSYLNGKFGSEDISAVLTAIVMEFVALGMMIIAGIVLWRALYTTFYRFIGILFIMMLSPIGAASLFSPIESWQSIGKQMFDKFWKMVVFYPAFIFGLILVNLLSTGFSKVTNPNTLGGEGLVTLLTRIIGAGISIMGLWLITDYFAKSFEEDMNKISSGVKSVATSAMDGLQKMGKVGNGFLKLGGGTISNAGRLLSTVTNPLLQKKFKDQANKAALEASELKKELDSNVDPKTGKELTEQQKANKLSQIQYLRRQEDNYKDLQRKGLGRMFINTGNTIGYSGDRAASTAKNVAGYFRKLGESYKAEDDLYWQTQMNRGVKRFGGNDMADLIFSGAANVGITADAEAAMAEEAASEGLANPFDNILNDKRDEVIKNSLGLKERELRRDVAQKLIPRLINKAQGDLSNLSQAEARLLEEVVDIAANDEQLGRELFGNKEGAALVQQMTANNMISSDTGTKLAETWGNTLGSQEERQSAGARLAKDQRAFEKADKSIFNDPDVLEGYKQAMNGDLSAISKSKGNFGRLHDTESIDSAKSMVAQVAPITGNKDYRDAVETATNSIQDNFRNSPFSGHQDVLHELAKLHADDSLDEAGYKKASDEVMTKAFAQQFGIKDADAAKLLKKNGGMEALQSKDIAATFDAGGNSAKAKAMVDELIKKSDVALYAQNNVRGFSKMDPVQQLAIIKQATLQQMVSANKNVDTYRAKANTTSAELNIAQSKGASKAKIHEHAKKSTNDIVTFAAENKISGGQAELADLQRAIITGNPTNIEAALRKLNADSPANIKAALEVGSKAITANGAIKIKGDLENAFATGDKKAMAKFLEDTLGADSAKSEDLAKEIRRQAGSSATVQADIIDKFSQAISKYSENGGFLDAVSDKDAIKTLEEFGANQADLVTAGVAKIGQQMEEKGGNFLGGIGASTDPNNILNNLVDTHKGKAGKAYGDAIKSVNELDPDYVTPT